MIFARYARQRGCSYMIIIETSTHIDAASSSVMVRTCVRIVCCKPHLHAFQTTLGHFCGRIAIVLSAAGMCAQVKTLGKRAAEEVSVPYGDVARHMSAMMLKPSFAASKPAAQHQESLGLRSSSLGALQSLEPGATGADSAEPNDLRPTSWRERRRNKAK